MEAASLRLSVTAKLPQLQNLIKRDPAGYEEDFLQQYRHFHSELQIFRLEPTKDSDSFGGLINFLSHVAPCYPNRCKDFPDHCVSLLQQHGEVLSPTVRVTIAQALLLLRNRGVIEAVVLFPVLFDMFEISDKTLRSLCYSHMISDVRKMHAAGANSKASKAVQSYVCSIASQQTKEVAAKKALDLLIELYRRRVWTDERCVNTIAQACLSKCTKISCVAMRFFLGIEQKMADDEEKEVIAVGEIKINEHKHSKKTKSRARQTEKQEATKKRKADALANGKNALPLFPALQIIRDPQGLSEKLFRKLRNSNESFEVKLLLMNMISRLVGTHQLQLLSFYTFVQKYLSNHQREVTQILAYLVQACHELVPPDEILPVIKSISFNFITERCSDEVISVGLNAVREVLSRIPAVLMEEGMDDLMQDFVMYTRSHDKSIKMAARAVINLVREAYPALLRNKDRGKFHTKGAKPLAFGQRNVLDGAEGAELLDAYERGELDIDLGEGGDGGFEESENEAATWVSDDEGTENMVEEDDDDEEEEEGENEEEEKVWKNVSDDEEDEEDDDEDGWDEVEDDDEEVEEVSTKKSRKKRRVPEEVEEVDKKVKKGRREEDVPTREKRIREEEEEDWEEGVETPKSKSTQKKTKREKQQEKIQIQKNLSRSAPDPTRILSSEDFEKIRRLREAFGKEVTHKPSSSSSMTANQGDSFAPENLAAYTVKRRTTIEDRMQSVLEGRSKFQLGGHAGGLTNKEKLRTKNLSMIRNGKLKRKMNEAGKQVARKRTKEVKQLKHDLKKRRRT